MSSIAQYKEFLKRERRINADLKEQNQLLNIEVNSLRRFLNNRLEEKPKKKWYQFWK